MYLQRRYYARTKNIVLFLMDMDGTLYLENELIPGARDLFIV